MLTNETYFSSENQMKYMGTSQYKAFCKCEAAALAELRGEYVRPMSTALLVGSYVDAYYEGTLSQFETENPALFKRDGTLKSEYQKADEIIRRLESDALFSLLMSGEKQVIRTGEIAGVAFKIKIDSLLNAKQCEEIARNFPETRDVFSFCDGAIVDLKCMKDMQDVWSDEEECRLSFVEAWGYDLQGAAYQAVEGNGLPFILAVGTKEAEPNLAAITIHDADLSARLTEMEYKLPRYRDIKLGLIAPDACGHCAYCRRQKKLTRIVDYRLL